MNIGTRYKMFQGGEWGSGGGGGVQAGLKLAAMLIQKH